MCVHTWVCKEGKREVDGWMDGWIPEHSIDTREGGIGRGHASAAKPGLAHSRCSGRPRGVFLWQVLL